MEAGTQVAVIEGWDTNATTRTSDDPSRRASALSGVEGVFVLRSHGERDRSSEVRVVGRLQSYTPVDGSFTRRDGFVGVAWLDFARVARRTQVANVGSFTLGTVQGARGTDLAPSLTFDPLAIDRVGWMVQHAASLRHELGPASVYRAEVGVSVAGTLREELVGVPGTRAGLDWFTGFSRLGVRTSTSSITWIEPRVSVDRTRLAYVLEHTTTGWRVAPSIDSSDATPSVLVRHEFDRQLAGTIELGATFAWPSTLDPVRVLPFAVATLTKQRAAWTLRANASFTYTAVDARVGPSATADAGLFFVGRPFRTRAWQGVAAILALDAVQSRVIAGPSASSTVNSAFASATLRLALTSWLGALCGYDGRWSSLSGGDVTFVRHLFFVGFAGAFGVDPRSLPTTTLALLPPP